MLRRVRAAVASALQQGALEPIATDVSQVAGGRGGSELTFAVRVVKNLARKDAAGRRRRDPTASVDDGKDGTPKKNKRFNPFLPYDPRMYVQHVPPAHVLLLNKFNVVDDHVLLVTAAYEEQNSLLTAADFAALWAVLRDVDGLAFYNAGTVAGASQHHKHLQIVAGALAPGLAPGRAPFEHALQGRGRPGENFRVDEFRFAHAAVSMADCMEAGVQEAARKSMARYTAGLHEVMRSVEQTNKSRAGSGAMPFPYNLLVTRRWMLLVPRREECFQGVSVNSLGFAGCLLVRSEEQRKVVEDVGAMKVLEHTAFYLG